MGSSITEYNIYCDESYVHGNVAFALGALICSPRRSEILDEKINTVRVKYDYTGEFKWKKSIKEVLRCIKIWLMFFY